MAHQNKITNWILEHKSILQPAFTQFEWPKRYFNQIYDFGLFINISGIETYGRGVDQSSNLAVEKASAEALERWVCKHLKIPSVGVALSGENSAAEHATNETLERFFLFEHIQKGQSFCRVSHETIYNFKSFAPFITHFNETNKLSIVNFYKMATPIGTNGIACTIIDENHNTICGFSYSDNLEKALLKSFHEALPNFAAIQEKKIKSQIIQETSKQDNESVWHIEHEFLNKLIPLLKSTEEETSFIFKLPAIKLQKIDISHFPELTGCPINPFRAEIVLGDT